MAKPPSIRKVSYLYPSSVARMCAGLSLIAILVWTIPGMLVTTVDSIKVGKVPLVVLKQCAWLPVQIIFVYIVGLLLAVGYNILAKYSGGIQIELSQESP